MNRRNVTVLGAAVAIAITPVAAAVPVSAAANQEASQATAAKVRTITARGSQAAFVTPSGNITCVMTGNNVRCDTLRNSWRLPRQPSWCDVDWGNGLEVSGRSRAHIPCAGDTVAGSAMLSNRADTRWFNAKRDLVVNKGYGRQAGLRYGYALRLGSTSCTSTTSGVTCRNKYGHGFSMASRTYRLW